MWISMWHANRNKPVGQNTKLAIEGSGNLVLEDADGSLVWSMGTSFADLANLTKIGVDMTCTGNMHFLDKVNGNAKWQSFAFPSNTLLPRQLLCIRKMLTSLNLATPTCPLCPSHSGPSPIVCRKLTSEGSHHDAS
ncbi:hypothetical protein M758_9G115600 [Ceratodon purpureus]|nr:hypothetical protein M758_9G115600 [Ceratodon purpureus]